MLLDKRAADITLDDILNLVNEKVVEDHHLEYKEGLSSKELIRELCKDVSGFANARGGVIILGVEEARDNNNSHLGYPASLPGLDPTGNSHQEITRLANILRDNITPRLSPFPEIELLPLPETTRQLVIIRVLRSWAQPHMAHNTFYARQHKSTLPLRVEQIRATFLEESLLENRLNSFRMDRLSKILSTDLEVPLNNSPIITAHFSPISAYNDPAFIDVNALPSLINDNIGRNSRNNFDGRLYHDSYGGNPANQVTQVFRDGRIEHTILFDSWRPQNQSKAYLTTPALLQFLDSGAPTLVSNLLNLAPLFPMHVGIAILNAGGLHIQSTQKDEFIHERGGRLPNTPLVFPWIFLESNPSSWLSALRPTLDRLWQSGGYQGCPFIAEDGTLLLRTS